MEQNKKFIELRKRLNLSQLEFADKVGVSRSTIADIERGRIGVSKRVKSKIVEQLKIEPGWFDDEKTLQNVEINQGIESGYNQGGDKKIVEISGINSPRVSSFPNEYFNGEGQSMKHHFEKKLLLDIIHNYPKINELHSYLNTIQTFEYIIINLNNYYFNNIDFRLHSSIEYLEKGRFRYDQFKEDFIKEIEKLEQIRPALSKISGAIELFYKELEGFDTEKVISGYFGETIDKSIE